ncbi:unnamed protein product [Tetraodon nigroviridis]|uniref:(spotted green pufferfish) hypothetical protein n=1 Tax=Tetraodon nigroviridis TaxID=99883 RepID=Q4T577_TETNG|nr:unnamed protein product [Tetraodon nigroviridis]
MDSNGVTSPCKDKWDADGDRQSLRSTKQDSPESLRRQEEENDDDNAKNRTWHSDLEQDQLSDGDGGRSTPSFYSDEYDSPSEGPKSPYSQSGVSSHSPHRQKQAKTTSSTAINKKGYGGRPGAYRQEHLPRHLQAQQHHKAARSQTKEYAPCKDLDVATKRLLSSRLLKINQLKNAFAELQQQNENIQMENRTLRQVQARLQHHNDTEGQVAQLMSRHASETHVYHERLRRCHEQEVEHSKELSNNLYQRQLAAERRKTLSIQEENQTLQQMLEDLTRKLRVSIHKDQTCSREGRLLSLGLFWCSLEEGERTGRHEHLRQPCGEILGEERHGERQQTERHSHAQQQATDRNQEASLSRDGAELRRKKDQLLAKMREIDDQNQVGRQALLVLPNTTTAADFYRLTETEDLSGVPADAGGREGRRRSGLESPARGAGRRALQSPSSGEDLLFGNYAPSFINPSSRRSLNFPAAAPAEKRDAVLETVSLLHSRGSEVERRTVEEDKKSNFLQQLFGSVKVADSRSVFDNTDVHSPPPATNGPRTSRERPFSFNLPESAASTAHTAHSRPAVRALASFDADIEEITL